MQPARRVRAALRAHRVPGRSRCRRRDGSARGVESQARCLERHRGAQWPRRRSGSTWAVTGRQGRRRRADRARGIAGRNRSLRAETPSRRSIPHEDAQFLACARDCALKLVKSSFSARGLGDDHHVPAAVPAVGPDDHSQLSLHVIAHHGTADTSADRETQPCVWPMCPARHSRKQRMPRTTPGPHDCREVLASPESLRSVPLRCGGLSGWLLALRALRHVTLLVAFEADEGAGEVVRVRMMRARCGRSGASGSRPSIVRDRARGGAR